MKKETEAPFLRLPFPYMFSYYYCVLGADFPVTGEL